MSEVRTLTWPLRVGANGQFASTEQGSETDVASCVAAILCYPRGWRPDNIEFGRPADIAFTQGGTDTAAIVRAIAEQEPRATPGIVAEAIQRVGEQHVLIDLEG